MIWDFRHFERKEFPCKCCGYFPQLAEDHYYYMVFYFLEALRKDAGSPIDVWSGLRCKKNNNSCGGSIYSYHIILLKLGWIRPCAVDIYSEKYDWQTFDLLIRKHVNLNYCGYHIYINEKGLYFMHIDFRGYKARWK